MSDTNFTYGETTVLADTDDIAQVTETVQSGIEQVLADTEDLNNDHSTLDAKLDTITTELSAIKKSVSDGKTLVAGAITAKGIDTATDAEFATIASNIESIVTLDSAPGLEAQSYTPGTSNIVIGAGNYLKGDQTIVGDSNLVAANIAKGKSIFGVTGTYAPGVSLNGAKTTMIDLGTSFSSKSISGIKSIIITGTSSYGDPSHVILIDPNTMTYVYLCESYPSSEDEDEYINIYDATLNGNSISIGARKSQSGKLIDGNAYTATGIVAPYSDDRVDFTISDGYIDARAYGYGANLFMIG